MRSRDVLLAAVERRLTQARDEDDARTLRTDEAVRDAADLAAVIYTGNDLAAATALARFHWRR
jgi:hypothetical protein